MKNTQPSILSHFLNALLLAFGQMAFSQTVYAANSSSNGVSVINTSDNDFNISHQPAGIYFL